jgi:integrase
MNAQFGAYKPTRHRLTREEQLLGLAKMGKSGADKRWGTGYAIRATIQRDQAFQDYVIDLKTRRGRISKVTVMQATSGALDFLLYLGREISATSLSELIKETREQHRNDDFTTDKALKRYIAEAKVHTKLKHASFVKGIFKANGCILTASVPQWRPAKSKRISPGILKAIYEALPREELRLLIDFCAHAAERKTALCRLTPLTSWEDDGEFTVIRFDPTQTKVNYEHISIIPKPLADEIRSYARATGRGEGAPFPNVETLWREITKVAAHQFGIHLTANYMRKRFVSIAKLTPMPPNDWDFLAGHKQRVGNWAHHYQLEDDNQLVEEYEKFLAPFLSISDPKEPYAPKEPLGNKQLELILKENTELREQILKLLGLLTETWPKQAKAPTLDSPKTLQ